MAPLGHLLESFKENIMSILNVEANLEFHYLLTFGTIKNSLKTTCMDYQR
jgi:hypothetical protein